MSTATTLIELDELPDDLEAEWAALAERRPTSPFLHPGFVRRWVEAFDPGSIALAVTHRGGRLVAAMPLVKAGRRLAAAANWHSVEAGVVADDEASAAELISHLFAARPASVELPFVDAATAGQLRAAAREAGYVVSEESLVRSPFLEVTGDWEAFYATIPGKRRSELRRLRRRLAEQGELSLEVVTEGEEDVERALTMLMAIEAKGWKGAEGTAIARQEETQRFYREIARWAAAQGWLRMQLLKLDGVAIAATLSLIVDGVYYGLKLGVDPDWQRFKPGIVLIDDVVREAFELGLRRVEMLGDDDAYKRTWCSHTRERLVVNAFSPSPAGRMRRFALREGRAVTRRLRRVSPTGAAAIGGGATAVGGTVATLI